MLRLIDVGNGPTTCELCDLRHVSRAWLTVRRFGEFNNELRFVVRDEDGQRVILRKDRRMVTIDAPTDEAIELPQEVLAAGVVGVVCKTGTVLGELRAA